MIRKIAISLTLLAVLSIGLNLIVPNSIAVTKPYTWVIQIVDSAKNVVNGTASGVVKQPSIVVQVADSSNHILDGFGGGSIATSGTGSPTLTGHQIINNQAADPIHGLEFKWNVPEDYSEFVQFDTKTGGFPWVIEGDNTGGLLIYGFPGSAGITFGGDDITRIGGATVEFYPASDVHVRQGSLTIGGEAGINGQLILKGQSGSQSISTDATASKIAVSGPFETNGFTYLQNPNDSAGNNFTAEIGVNNNENSPTVAYDIYTTSTQNLDKYWLSEVYPVNAADPTAGSNFEIYPKSGGGGFTLDSSRSNVYGDNRPVFEFPTGSDVQATNLNFMIGTPGLTFVNVAGAGSNTPILKFKSVDDNTATITLKAPIASASIDFPLSDGRLAIIANTPLSFPFATGLIAALPATTSLYGIVKPNFAGTLTGGVVIFAGTTLTCTTQPTVKLQDCGASAPTTCGSPTTLATAVISAANTAIDMTINSSTVTVNHYLAFEISAGACSVVAGGFNGTVVGHQ